MDGYFGNPVKLNDICPVCDELHTTRGSTISCFEAYARRRISVDPKYRQRVKELHGKTLGCFCVPLPCHGHVLEKLAGELNR